MWECDRKRRQVLKWMGFNAGVLFVAPTLLSGCTGEADREVPEPEVNTEDAPSSLFENVPDGYEIIQESDPDAQKFEYRHNHRDLPDSFANEGSPGDGPKMCATCEFFTQVKNSQFGDCSVIPGDALVSANGVCTGWRERGVESSG